jgi:hypothetical protein
MFTVSLLHMPGARASRRRLVRTAAAVATLALAVPPAQAGPAGSRSSIPLAAPVHHVDPLSSAVIGLRKDRLKTSVAPGRVDDREDVTVAVGPDGTPAAVTDLQRLTIAGAGNYVIRERGPARAAVGLGDSVPPVLELGTVVWQGFSPGRRSLAARLALDAGIEAARLPMRVRIRFQDAFGRPSRLGPGGLAPVSGRATVTLTNQTGSARTVATGRPDVGPLAAVLDRLYAAGNHPRAAVPPVAGAGLPKALPGHVTASVPVTAVAALRVTGTIGGGPVSGPGTTAAGDGVRVEGTLDGDARFLVALAAGSRLALRLDVRPWIDPRTVTPPAPAATWRRWAAGGPSATDLAHAMQTLATAAASSARAAEYSPYLQADVPGPDLSTFTYVVAPATTTRRAADALQAKPGAIIATVIALLAIAGNAALLRRRL